MKKLSHADAAGRARMVDVGTKAPTARTARAEGSIAMNASALNAVRENTVAKGDVLATARIAGIMGAKRTSDLIPLCHPLNLTDVGVDISIDEDLSGLRVIGWASTTAQTGVEMEALTAVSVALLTIYDMVKALDRRMQIGEIRVTEKRGGASGDVAPYERER
jgi:cyclic pyranopterin monophosphate synthase